MVFNRTSCGKSLGGFTLVEYMVATSIGLVVISAALVLWAYATKTCGALLSYVELSGASQSGLDRVSQQIRNAATVQSCSSNQLVLLDPSGQKITLAYDSSTRTLNMTNGTARTTLLTECTNFQFSVYQRTPVSNSFELYTNGWSTNTAKVVQVRWTSTRKLSGDKSAVETQVSSKVVIRNQ